MPKSDNPYNKVYEDQWWDFWKIIAVKKRGKDGDWYYVAINFDNERKEIPIDEFPPEGWERVSFDPFNPKNNR